MATLLQRLFSQETGSQRERPEVTQEEQTATSRSMRRNVETTPKKQEYVTRSRLTETEMTSLKLLTLTFYSRKPSKKSETRAHYPIYDPNDPNHNPRARKRHHSSDSWTPGEKSADRSTEETWSAMKPIRRAGSSFAALAESIRPKSKVRRPPVPFQPAVISTIYQNDGAPLGHTTTEGSYQQHEYIQHSTGTRVMTTELAANSTEPFSQLPLPSIDISEPLTTGCRVIRGFIPFRRVPPVPLERVTNRAKYERSTRLPLNSPMSPPPEYSLYGTNFTSDGGGEDSRLSVIGTQKQGPSGANNLETLGNGNLTSATSQAENPPLAHNVRPMSEAAAHVNANSNKTSVTAMYQLPLGTHKASLAKSRSLTSLNSDVLSLDVAKQLPSHKRAPPEAPTEFDTEFDVEIYHTTGHERQNSTGEHDPTLLSWLTSTDPSRRELDYADPGPSTNYTIGSMGFTELIRETDCGRYLNPSRQPSARIMTSTESRTNGEVRLKETNEDERSNSGLSLRCSVAAPVSPLHAALRYSVEAIDRLAGFELPDPYTHLQSPRQAQCRVSSLKFQRYPGHKQDSSSGSNDSGQSDPTSRVSTATLCSSVSSGSGTTVPK